jgi:GNAT superfamily N-acetyltransferase
MHIRVAQRDDIETLFDIRTSVVENHQSREEIAALGITPASVAAMLETDCCAWVAERGDSPTQPSRPLLVCLYCQRPRGKGTGRVLMAAAEQWLWSHGLEEIWLLTGNDPNLRAYGFYLHLGWQAVGAETGRPLRRGNEVHQTCRG